MTSVQEFEPVDIFSSQELLAQVGIAGEPRHDLSTTHQDQRYSVHAEPYIPVLEVERKGRKKWPLPKREPTEVTAAASIADLAYLETSATQEAPLMPVPLDSPDPNILLL